MPFEFIQIPANVQGSAKEELNKLLRGGRIASVRKEIVANGEDSFWAFCIFPEQREQLPRREPQQQHRVPHCPQLRPTVPDGTMSMGLNRPPSRSHPVSGCDKSNKRPPGAGSPVDAGSKAPGGQLFLRAACLGLLWPSMASAVVVGVPDIDGSRLIGQSYGGVGMLEIVETGGSYRGTGVLLNDRWLLTAAHNWDAGAVTHLAFSINGQRHEAAEWVQHPGWDGSFSPSQGWDVGLVRLAMPVAGFGTTKLYAGNSELGMTLTVLGTGLAGMAGGSLDTNSGGTVFGFTNTIDRVVLLGGLYGSGGLLIYDFDNGLPAKNSLEVASAYDAFGQPVARSGGNFGSGSSLAMTSLEGTSALGDSGGPAFTDFGNGPELVGIVSWGVNPTEPGNLYGSGFGDVGYLMRVSSLNGWITSVIPEPGTAMLTIAGAFVWLRRRR